MKIKVFLLETEREENFKEDLRRFINFINDKCPKLAEILKKLEEVDLSKIYIELDTNSLFDDFFPENQELLKTVFEIPLRKFATLLLNAISYDVLIARQRGHVNPGTQIIINGLNEMEKEWEEMKKQKTVSRTSWIPFSEN